MGEHYENRYREYLNTIEGYLNDVLPIEPSIPQKDLIEGMRYSLLAGGKRLRPVFVLDFCRMCGGDIADALPFAAAVEMIHTYSLIHDDLPCMDNDDYRRGKLTNHKVFGEALAVLAGDALLTSAFNKIAQSKLDAEIRINAIGVLSECAGELGMVGGQVLDIQAEQRLCSAEEVLNIHTGKTVALIRAACVLGVLAGKGTTEQISAASDFAFHLGLAFQIRDDMLDVIGNQETLGKAVGTDGNKNTFVRLYGLEECDRMVKEHTEKAMSALCQFEDPSFMIYIAKMLVNRDK